MARATAWTKTWHAPMVLGMGAVAFYVRQFKEEPDEPSLTLLGVIRAWYGPDLHSQFEDTSGKWFHRKKDIGRKFVDLIGTKTSYKFGAWLIVNGWSIAAALAAVLLTR